MTIFNKFSLVVFLLLFVLVIADMLNAQITFTDSGQSLGSGRSFGIVLCDVYSDNDLDAFITDYIGSSQIWLNDGNGIYLFSGQSFVQDLIFHTVLLLEIWMMIMTMIYS